MTTSKDTSGTPQIDAGETDIAWQAAKDQRIAELEASLKEQRCIRPCSGRPDDFQIGQCVDASECGCGADKALGRARNAGGR